jgi:hypothetical protein
VECEDLETTSFGLNNEKCSDFAPMTTFQYGGPLQSLGDHVALSLRQKQKTVQSMFPERARTHMTESTSQIASSVSQRSPEGLQAHLNRDTDGATERSRNAEFDDTGLRQGQRVSSHSGTSPVEAYNAWSMRGLAQATSGQGRQGNHHHPPPTVDPFPAFMNAHQVGQTSNLGFDDHYRQEPSANLTSTQRDVATERILNQHLQVASASTHNSSRWPPLPETDQGKSIRIGDIETEFWAQQQQRLTQQGAHFSQFFGNPGSGQRVLSLIDKQEISAQSKFAGIPWGQRQAEPAPGHSASMFTSGSTKRMRNESMDSSNAWPVPTAPSAAHMPIQPQTPGNIESFRTWQMGGQQNTQQLVKIQSSQRLQPQSSSAAQYASSMNTVQATQNAGPFKSFQSVDSGIRNSAFMNNQSFSQAAAPQSSPQTQAWASGRLTADDSVAALRRVLNQERAVALPRPTQVQATGRESLCLYTDSDTYCLSQYQCLLRKQLELFQASEIDVQSNAQGRNRPVTLGQVGIRCRHCSTWPPTVRARGSTYYPAKLERLYQAAQNMATSHLHKMCHLVPENVREELNKMKTQKSPAGSGKRYW